MKIAVSGKGGAGKTTLAAALSLLYARRGQKVIAVDADPDANLAQALGVREAERSAIVPIARMAALVEERTGAKVDQYGQIFKLNPEVADIAGKYAYLHRGVALLVLGAIERGGGGCACAESVLLRALVTDLVLYKGETLVMDMEAGVEHLGRATARGVDEMIVVVEPGQRSIDTARRVIRMSAEIGLPAPAFVVNKARSAADEEFARRGIAAAAAAAEAEAEATAAAPGAEPEVLGVIPYSDEIALCDRDGMAVLDAARPELAAVFESIASRLADRQGARR
jgi:CO dehydrogenase maturation factor